MSGIGGYRYRLCLCKVFINSAKRHDMCRGVLHLKPATRRIARIGESQKKQTIRMFLLVLLFFCFVFKLNECINTYKMKMDRCILLICVPSLTPLFVDVCISKHFTDFSRQKKKLHQQKINEAHLFIQLIISLKRQ